MNPWITLVLVTIGGSWLFGIALAQAARRGDDFARRTLAGPDAFADYEARQPRSDVDEPQLYVDVAKAWAGRDLTDRRLAEVVEEWSA